MPYRSITLPTLIAAGTPAGSAVGTVYSDQVMAGNIRAVYFAYGGTATTTDVALMASHFNGTILAVNNSATTGWYYPATVVHDGTAGTISGVYAYPHVIDHLKVTLAGGSAGIRSTRLS
jgi:hypothetical protein